jgi:hypothetical protein
MRRCPRETSLAKWPLRHRSLHIGRHDLEKTRQPTGEV